MQVPDRGSERPGTSLIDESGYILSTAHRPDPQVGTIVGALGDVVEFARLTGDSQRIVWALNGALWVAGIAVGLAVVPWHRLTVRLICAAVLAGRTRVRPLTS